MTRLRIAVVGTGALGRHHARILSELDQVELVAVADTNAAAGQQVADGCGTRWVADFRELVELVDAAVIAVTTSAHAAVAAEFLCRGAPVLVEKPICPTLDEARRLVALAAAHQALLQVGHIERFNPAFRAALPGIGSPRYVRSERYSNYTFRSTDIGVVHDMMIHDLDLVQSIVQSEVERVEAFGITIMGGHEDSVQARVVFANGCVADFSASRVSPAARRTMQTWSDAGCTHLDLGAREVTHYAPGEMLKYGTPPVERARLPQADIEQLKSDVFGAFVKINRPTVRPCDQLTEELLAFIDCVRRGVAPIVDGNEALKSMELADRILKAAGLHRWDAHRSGIIGPATENPQPRRLAG
jgi:predicted dehydrogenase